MTSNTVSNTRPIEVLLLSANSTDPFSTQIVDPRTGVATWSYKGSELQNGLTGVAHPIGISGDHFLVSIHDRPLLHAVAFHHRDKFHAKAVLAGVPRALITSKDGSLLFLAINTQVFVWLLPTGELLTVVDAHYQNVTGMALSADDAILFTCSNDGALHAYLISDMISVDRDASVSPLRKWRPHSLAARSLCVSGALSPRVVSCGMDHTVTIHSVSLDSCLLKVSADRPLTACAIDPSESRIFVATDLGNIAQINLYEVGEKREILIQTADERNAKIPVFNGHTEEITKLAVNGDGTLLASADSSGKYCIWDIHSKQCLKVSTMRGPVSTLQFIPNWESLSSSETKQPHIRPNMVLKRNPTTGTNITITHNGKPDTQTYWQSECDLLVDKLLRDSESGNSKIATEPVYGYGAQRDEINQVPDRNSKRKDGELSSSDIQLISSESTDVIELKKEIAKLKKINAELYEFATKELVNE